jgi:hypothetical protein
MLTCASCNIRQYLNSSLFCSNVVGVSASFAVCADAKNIANGLSNGSVLPKNVINYSFEKYNRTFLFVIWW